LDFVINPKTAKLLARAGSVRRLTPVSWRRARPNTLTLHRSAAAPRRPRSRGSAPASTPPIGRTGGDAGRCVVTAAGL